MSEFASRGEFWMLDWQTEKGVPTKILNPKRNVELQEFGLKVALLCLGAVGLVRSGLGLRVWGFLISALRVLSFMLHPHSSPLSCPRLLKRKPQTQTQSPDLPELGHRMPVSP